jgi:hypothetical protein
MSKILNKITVQYARIWVLASCWSKAAIAWPCWEGKKYKVQNDAHPLTLKLQRRIKKEFGISTEGREHDVAARSYLFLQANLRHGFQYTFS